MDRGAAPLIGVWERRLERAAELSSLWPFAREVLGFYRAVTECQSELLLRLPEPSKARVDFLVQFFPSLFELVERKGPPGLIKKAEEARASSEEEWRAALASFWKGERREGLESFFPKALLQPYAFRLALEWRKGEKARAEPSETGACPFCKHPPAVGILREESGPEGVARSLVCSLCSLEWGFPRILCPGCKEEDPDKLPRFTAQEIPWMRLEACETCGRYLKAADSTKDRRAVPLVDEIASTPLDVLAGREGFVKLETNLCGI
jgi:FdhE protein